MKRLLCLLWIASLPAFADGAADNLAENVRRIPPVGTAIPDGTRATLTTEAAKLASAIEAVRGQLAEKPDLLRYLPDVLIFHKAVDWALRYDEFFDPKQTAWASAQLKEGFARLEALAQGRTPWLESTGLIPRGYQSKIDGSIQPFGMVVPDSFQKNLPYRWRLDCWFHGRGETLTELDFIHQRQTNPGEFTPQDTLVLHPYGRYCNGSRFAGETDFFEALDTVKRDYRVDEDRIIVRGFSLGGAACWHLATHHASQWCAANPGAGFSETEQFLNFFQGEKLQPQPWERQLWNLYDATAVAGNLFNCPTVAYSGEIDKQKQAADLMAAALQKEGITLTHIIGPQTAHKYEPRAKAEVVRRIDALAVQGRKLSLDSEFVTSTLQFNRFPLGTVDALEEHWKAAKLASRYDSVFGWRVTTSNISALTVTLPPGFGRSVKNLLGIGLELALDAPQTPDAYVKPDPNQPVPKNIFPIAFQSDGSFTASFVRDGDIWKIAARPQPGLRKKHNLQGPIDDAFMSSFIFVRPTGKPASEKTAAWANAELERAIEHWRRHFRGDARVKDDTAITEDDIKSANLILWGDPSSNSLIAKTAAQLPISWTGSEIKAGGKTFPAADHALICIYPNPLNPERYLVLNSSFTFREYDYLNNARQTPKLPDWAIIDLNQAPNTRTPGRIAAADFFNEKWELKP
jgi:Prolyl oligopeptidase family